MSVKVLERAGKRMLAGLAKRVIAPAGKGHIPAAPSRILVIRADNRLGNLLLLTPLLDAIAAAFPHARTDVLVSGDAYPDVYRHHAAISDVISVPKKSLARSPWGVLAFRRALRERNYDVVLDASHMHEFSFTSALGAWLTGSPCRVGYARGDANHYFHLAVPPASSGTHESEVHLRLLRALYPSAPLPVPAALKPSYALTADEKKAALIMWSRLGLGADVVGIFVGARGNKQWGSDAYSYVIRHLAERGLSCAVFGGPGERDLVSQLTRGSGAIAVPELPLRDFAAVLAQCRMLITPDTGPMHLAVALGVKTIELFVASDADRYGYAHVPGHVVLRGQDCSPSAVVGALQSGFA